MFVFNQWVLKIITSTLRTNMNPPLIDDIQFTSSPASFFATFSKADLEKKKGFEKIAVGSLVDDKIKICFPFTRHIHRHSLLLTLLTYFISKNLTCASQQRAAFKDDVPSHWSFQSCCPRHYPELVMCLHWARAIGIFFLIVVLVANSCQILLQLYPARLLCQWDFPGKNTGVGCHFLLQGIFLSQVEPASPTLAGRFFTTEPPRKPREFSYHSLKITFITCLTWQAYEVREKKPFLFINAVSLFQKQEAFAALHDDRRLWGSGVPPEGPLLSFMVANLGPWSRLHAPQKGCF